MNTKKKGNITEIETMLSFMKYGYSVLTPYGDCDRYDYAIDVDGKFYRIQSKTAVSEDNGDSFCIYCKSSNRISGKRVNKPYTKGEIDYFATSFKGQNYLIPVEKAGTSSFRLRINPAKNGQTTGVNWANDYKIETIIESWNR